MTEKLLLLLRLLVPAAHPRGDLRYRDSRLGAAIPLPPMLRHSTPNTNARAAELLPEAAQLIQGASWGVLEGERGWRDGRGMEGGRERWQEKNIDSDGDDAVVVLPHSCG